MKKKNSRRSKEEQKSAKKKLDNFDERIFEDEPFGTVNICNKDYEYAIDKIYSVFMLQNQKHRGSNITRGADITDLMQISKDIQYALEQASKEFSVSPIKCRNMLIEAKVIDHSALHFAKILFTQNYGLEDKSEYLFNSKDAFNVSVKEIFFTLFDFENLSLKEFLVAVHEKVLPPFDSDKKADFYSKLCQEYCSQNHHRNVNPDNVEFMLSCTFFVISGQKQNLKRGGISFEQYVKYAETHGDDFISPRQAEVYFEEIISGKFLPDTTMFQLHSDGAHRYEQNMQFMRNLHKMNESVNTDDPFFSERCKVKKLQYKKLGVGNKEICINEKSKTFKWYNEGLTGAKIINFKDIMEVEIDFTPEFLKYHKDPKFKDVISDPKL